MSRHIRLVPAIPGCSVPTRSPLPRVDAEGPK